MRGAKPTVWLEVDFHTFEYSRCDNRGCDHYNAEVKVSGAFVIVSPRPGAFVKVLAPARVRDGGMLVDVATTGTSVYQNFGECRPRL